MHQFREGKIFPKELDACQRKFKYFHKCAEIVLNFDKYAIRSYFLTHINLLT